jgi:hypothetical protein
MKSARTGLRRGRNSEYEFRRNVYLMFSFTSRGNRTGHWKKSVPLPTSFHRIAPPDATRRGLHQLDKQGRFAQAAPQRARAEMRAQIPDLP